MRERIATNDTLLVVRTDLLARSRPPLLRVIERVEAKDAFFCSILPLIHTASPQHKVM
ncbi:MAG: hypothetical protein ACXIUW_02630 [Roseinatronobacter sp.]